MSEHSPLGASGAERWSRCHGSVALLAALHLDESDEEDWTREGTAMHEGAAKALEEALDAWELVGHVCANETELTPALADPLQTYIEHCRPLMAATKTYGVEYKISSPVHPLFYGRADFWSIAPGSFYGNALHVVDFKGGQGIMVDVEENMQLMYYGFGVIDGLERQRSYVFGDDQEVVLTIVQPRGFHHEGPVRSWSTSVGYIKGWVNNTLVPHMLATSYDNSLEAGPWCRFCPAKLVCPLLTTLFKAACLASPEHAPDMSDTQLGLNYKYLPAVESFVKALKKEAQKRMEQGKTLPVGDGKQLKLVYQKSNRVYKDGAADLAAARFGPLAFTTPELKSPAQLEKVPSAAAFVKEFTYQPRGNLTVALPDDSRPAIDVARLSERFEGLT
jgi:hypothetical protein